LEKSPTISAVVSTPPAAGMVSASMLVMQQPSNCAGGVLVDRLDVVVDLHDLDGSDAVLVGPLLDDARSGA
jgi:hypothetical protein